MKYVLGGALAVTTVLVGLVLIGVAATTDLSPDVGTDPGWTDMHHRRA